MLRSLRADRHQVVDEPTHALTGAQKDVRDGNLPLRSDANDNPIVSATANLATRNLDNVAVVHRDAVERGTTRRQRSRPVAVGRTLTRPASCSRWIAHDATLWAAPVGTAGGARPGSSARRSSTLPANTSRNSATRCVSANEGRSPHTT